MSEHECHHIIKCAISYNERVECLSYLEEAAKYPFLLMKYHPGKLIAIARLLGPCCGDQNKEAILKIVGKDWQG